MTARSSSSPVSGWINLYKPVGPGSQRLLSPIRRALGTRRVGHAGTLDPFASGVLPVAVGRATRLIDHLHAMPKRYRAVLRLGIETSTLDIEGEVTRRVDDVAPSSGDVRAALASFIGEIQQMPPAYSAARVDGRRAYDAARAGEAVELRPRTVLVHGIELLALDGHRLMFDVDCSTGTYVRSLGRDIAAALGTVGHLTRLTRTAVGPFQLEGALTPNEAAAWIDRLGPNTVLSPPDVVLADLPAADLSARDEGAVRHGRPTLVTVPRLEAGSQVRGFDGDGAALSLLETVDGTLEPRLLLQYDGE